MKFSISPTLARILLTTLAIVHLSGAGGFASRAAAQSNARDKSAAKLSLDDLFPKNRLLDVRITVAEKDWDEIRFQSRNLLEALQEKRRLEVIESPYTYVEASITIDGVKLPKVGLRKKGFIGSQSSSRPSLKIKLNHSDKSGQIDGLTSLTLNNNRQDPTQVSQFLGYRLFEAVGSPASRCGFAKVTVNGRNLGVYSHVETVRAPLLKREFGTAKGTLYEGTVVDFHEGWEGSFERKLGDDAAGRAQIKKLIRVLQETDDKDIEKAIGELVDLDAFYTYWAVEGLLGFWDGYSGNHNNFFVYLNPKTNKFHFLPWGADALFDKYSKLEYDAEAPISVKTKGLVAHKLYQTKSGRERYAKTLQAILDKHWNEKRMLAEADRIEAMLKPHLAPRQMSFSRALGKIRNFIRVRRKELEAEMAGGLPVWAKAPEPPPVIPASFALAQDPNAIWSRAKQGDVPAITKLLREGVKVDARDPSGSAPLAMASLAGHAETVKFLISKGADVNAKNNDAQTALHGAAFLGQLDVVELLVANKVDVNARNKKGETPLDVAAAEWSDEIQGIVQFISSILRVRVEMEQVRAGRPKVAALLRRSGAKLSSQLPKSSATLWLAAKAGDLRALKKHLGEKVDVNGHDQGGVTPLCWAALAGQTKAAELLIAKGADVNAKNRDGATPLTWAALAGQAKTAELLIEKGANVNAKGGDGGTALHAAAFLGRDEVVKLLIKHKAKVNEKNAKGETPLAIAAVEWNDEIAGFVRFIGSILQFKIDAKQVQDGRPKAAALLRKHGG